MQTISLAALLCTAVLAVSARPWSSSQYGEYVSEHGKSGFRSGHQYKYDLDMLTKTKLGMPQESHVMYNEQTALRILGKLVLSMPTDYTNSPIMWIEDATVLRSPIDLEANPDKIDWQPMPEDEINEMKHLLRLPMVFSMENGQIVGEMVSHLHGDREWSINVKKAIIQMFHIDLQKSMEIRDEKTVSDSLSFSSHLDMSRDTFESSHYPTDIPSHFVNMDSTIHGRCPTTYHVTVMPLSREAMKEEQRQQQLHEYKSEMFVRKSRNMAKCDQAVYNETEFSAKPCKTCRSPDSLYLHDSYMSAEYRLVGESKRDFHIEWARSISHIALPIPFAPKSFAVNTETEIQFILRNVEQGHGVSPSNTDSMISRDLPSFWSPEDSELRTFSRSKQTPEPLKIEHPVVKMIRSNEETPRQLENERDIDQVLNTIDSLSDKICSMTSQEQRSRVNGEKVEAFPELSFMTLMKLVQTVPLSRVYPVVKEKCEALALPVLTTCVKGYQPHLISEITKLTQSRKTTLSKMDWFFLHTAMARSTVPTAGMIREMGQACEAMTCSSSEDCNNFINNENRMCWYTYSTWVHRVCSKNHHEWSLLKNKECRVEEFVTPLNKMLEHVKTLSTKNGVENLNEKVNEVMKVIKNSGLVSLVPKIHELLRTPELRGVASIVGSLEYMTLQSPRLLRQIVLPVFMDITLPTITRLQAFDVIIASKPSYSVLELITSAMWTETNQKVVDYVYSGLRFSVKSPEIPCRSCAARLARFASRLNEESSTIMPESFSIEKIFARANLFGLNGRLDKKMSSFFGARYNLGVDVELLSRVIDLFTVSHQSGEDNVFVERFGQTAWSTKDVMHMYKDLFYNNYLFNNMMIVTDNSYQVMTEFGIAAHYNLTAVMGWKIGNGGKFSVLGSSMESIAEKLNFRLVIQAKAGHNLMGRSHGIAFVSQHQALGLPLKVSSSRQGLALTFKEGQHEILSGSHQLAVFEECLSIKCLKNGEIPSIFHDEKHSNPEIMMPTDFTVLIRRSPLNFSPRVYSMSERFIQMYGFDYEMSFDNANVKLITKVHQQDRTFQVQVRSPFTMVITTPSGEEYTTSFDYATSEKELIVMTVAKNDQEMVHLKYSPREFIPRITNYLGLTESTFSKLADKMEHFNLRVARGVFGLEQDFDLKIEESRKYTPDQKESQNFLGRFEQYQQVKEESEEAQLFKLIEETLRCWSTKNNEMRSRCSEKVTPITYKCISQVFNDVVPQQSINGQRSLIIASFESSENVPELSTSVFTHYHSAYPMWSGRQEEKMTGQVNKHAVNLVRRCMKKSVEAALTSRNEIIFEITGRNSLHMVGKNILSVLSEFSGFKYTDIIESFPSFTRETTRPTNEDSKIVVKFQPSQKMFNAPQFTKLNVHEWDATIALPNKVVRIANIEGLNMIRDLFRMGCAYRKQFRGDGVMTKTCEISSGNLVKTFDNVFLTAPLKSSSECRLTLVKTENYKIEMTTDKKILFVTEQFEESRGLKCELKNDGEVECNSQGGHFLGKITRLLDGSVRIVMYSNSANGNDVLVLFGKHNVKIELHQPFLSIFSPKMNNYFGVCGDNDGNTLNDIRDRTGVPLTTPEIVVASYLEGCESPLEQCPIAFTNTFVLGNKVCIADRPVHRCPEVCRKIKSSSVSQVNKSYLNTQWSSSNDFNNDLTLTCENGKRFETVKQPFEPIVECRLD